MSTKPMHWIGSGVVILLAVGLLAALQGALPVQAMPLNSPASSGCMTCHENQYYLYDTGTWYCVTEARDRCVNCHAGDADALGEQAAHTGLVANPFSDGGSRCRECHAGDAEARIQQVASLTGYHESASVGAYVPQGAGTVPEAYLLASLDEPRPSLWLIPAAVVLFGFWLALMERSGRP